MIELKNQKSIKTVPIKFNKATDFHIFEPYIQTIQSQSAQR